MKALSLQQPHAYLILQRADPSDPKTPLKPVENRAWPLPSTLKLPQRVLIHAGLGIYPVSMNELRAVIQDNEQWCGIYIDLVDIYGVWETHHGDKIALRKSGYFGCLIGSVVVTGQKFRDPDENANLYSPWSIPGQYGYTLESPVMFSKPVPYRGALGFFEVPDGVSAKLTEATSQ